ncbi:probable E3 ubiquitin-protein ligase RHC1A [Lactuca sativa]|uniref:RING-type E3 ubiquitin transferase n=1 Tax=Lactuca sativa TaxID=4236 RepID=A0A9R1V5F8_LACSA|nr:probable E3 ubiquitin-protein ligase RHC1A [Lactuca sativa]KAJ0198608.1 hypothetical protein LSAT_V11C700373540 [Lactuca sativa]
MSGARNTHWCYQCLEPVRLQGRNPICPYCSGGFVQELNEDFRPFHGHEASDYGFLNPFPNPRNRIMDSGFMDPFPNPRNRIMDAFAELIRQRVSERNPNLFEFFNGVPVDPNANNILMGTGLEDLIEQLIANNGRQGPPPATQSAIDSLPVIRITNRHLQMESHCPICQDKFDLGCEARMMPCHHIYHSGCIVPWLLEHNSCPVCRLELPPQGTGNISNNSSNSRNTQDNDQSDGRMNPLSFLWPF